MLSYLDRFGGAQNVLGRPLGYGEMRRMVAAENIVKAYQSRQQAQNWAQWTKDNPAASAALNEAMRLNNG